MSQPSHEILLASYAASAGTIAMQALARLGVVTSSQIADLIECLEDCRLGTPEAAAVDRFVDTQIATLKAAADDCPR